MRSRVFQMGVVVCCATVIGERSHVLTIEIVLMALSHVQALDFRSSSPATDWLQLRVESSGCSTCAAVYL